MTRSLGNKPIPTKYKRKKNYELKTFKLEVKTNNLVNYLVCVVFLLGIDIYFISLNDKFPMVWDKKSHLPRDDKFPPETKKKGPILFLSDFIRKWSLTINKIFHYKNKIFIKNKITKINKHITHIKHFNNIVTFLTSFNISENKSLM